ncbi:hypothetical protein AMECASPLE_016027 [Ameca splendens]|uniref:Uncharacterized protein n=1 Tax=Ameca splendens TaxID=208324 RepID=A0ABV1A8H0_9TELE
MCIQGFSIKICKSEREESQTRPWTRDRYGGDPSYRYPKVPQSTGTPGESPPGLPQLPQERSRGESQGNHPAATVQKPQGAAATSPQAPPAVVYARADPAMDPDTQDPGTYYSPSIGPTEPRDPGPSKYTGGQRYLPPAGSVAGRE